MANEYEIARGAGKCVASGRELTEGEFYYAALFEVPQGFERRDFCVEAWSGPPEGCFCYWKARVPTRERKPSMIAVDNGLLINLFCRLEEDISEMRQKFRFVLALLLMRKRLLRLEQTVREDDREHWRMRLVAEQSVHQVLNPHLSNEEIERLSAQLAAILSGDASAISAMEEQAADEPAELPSDPVATAAELAATVDPAATSPVFDAGATDAGPADGGEPPANADDTDPDQEDVRATE